MTLAVSLSMPILNRAVLVKRALDSVVKQNVEGVEVIVVDGGSTDGTTEVVKNYPFVRLIEAPKSSIYEAINIGIKAATAPIVGILNSDDRLPDGALGAILAAAAEDTTAMIVRGRVNFAELGADGMPRSLPKRNRGVALPLTLQGVTFGAPAINTCFVRAECYRAFGYFDETLRIAADRAWLLRAVLANVPVRLIDRPVYEYFVHDESFTIADGARGEAEYAREHLSIYRQTLASGVADSDARRLLTSWHAQEVLRLLRRGQGLENLDQDILRAFRDSPAWPIHAIGALFALAMRRLSNGPACDERPDAA